VRDTILPGNVAALEDGSRITWLRPDAPLVAGSDASLKFAITTPDGAPTTLEPYMGMRAHAVVVRDDGKVFIHLHPQGTISTAAQMSFAMRQPGDSIAGRLARRMAADTMTTGGSHASMASGMSHLPAAATAEGTVAFPYAFPEPGTYHIWVQARTEGRILTGAFVTTVRPAP